jgi:SAM-dependent methyltransferase
MNPAADYISINKESWNRRAEVHVKSDFYNVPAFLEGKSSLNEIELALLGDISGKTILHLQCHFGQDSISLARMGASVTGVDLSDRSIDYARELTEKTGADARFICCDIYDLPEHLSDQFDIVFTSYGTVGWLPDTDRWAGIVSRYLKPGGRFVFAEFHPVVWMFDDAVEHIAYSYFNCEPIIETESGTYADRDAPLQGQYVGWNHSLCEVMTSLIGSGLTIRTFREFDYSPYNIFPGMEEAEPRRYRITRLGSKFPLVYALTAEKGGS